MTPVLLICIASLAALFMLTFLLALVKDSRARQAPRKQPTLTEIISERYPQRKRAA